MDLSLPVADRAILHADNAYDLPAARITSHRLKTNTQSATAFRGFGGPQGMVGIERVMDHVAHVLGKRPVGGAADSITTPKRRAADGAPRTEYFRQEETGGSVLDTADLAGRGSVRRSRPAAGSATAVRRACIRRFAMEDHGQKRGHTLRDGGRGFHPWRVDRAAGSRRSADYCGAEGSAWRSGTQPMTLLKKRDRPDAGEIRHLLHADPSEPGRALWCMSTRTDRST
jgi:hypothetical protein